MANCNRTSNLSNTRKTLKISDPKYRIKHPSCLKQENENHLKSVTATTTTIRKYWSINRCTTTTKKLKTDNHWWKMKWPLRYKYNNGWQNPQYEQPTTKVAGQNLM